MQKITLQVRDVGAIQVPAQRVGFPGQGPVTMFWIHRSVAADHRALAEGWTITHGPSGLAVYQNIVSLPRAREVAKLFGQQLLEASRAGFWGPWLGFTKADEIAAALGPRRVKAIRQLLTTLVYSPKCVDMAITRFAADVAELQLYPNFNASEAI